MEGRRSRVCVLTAGHLATSPRMVKVADALFATGYSVRVVSTRHVAWATTGDASIKSHRGDTWSWDVVDYSRNGPFASRIYTSLRTRLARRAASAIGPRRVSRGIVSRARERVFPELVRMVLERPVDLIYGGGSALAATAEAACRMSVPFAFDLEDFHTGEYADSTAGRFASSLTERLEEETLPKAALLTAGSDSIAEAYARKYGLHPTAINNTFPLPSSPPKHALSHGALKLYWFSQTIGPGRGLEDVVAGVGIAAIAAELHLRGIPVPGYVESLRLLASRIAPSLGIIVHVPGPPDAMVELCRDFDVGLAVEDDRIVNRDLCLTNKALTYVLGGLAVLMSDTTGQRAFARSIGEGGILYPPRDTAAIAAALAHWGNDRKSLLEAQGTAWRAAEQRWNWDHPEESAKLIRAIGRVLPPSRPPRDQIDSL